MFVKKIMLAVMLLICFGFAEAQVHPPFYSEIRHFKAEDSVRFPPAHAILFVGSSSFAKWVDVQEYFPGYTIINRGFGGSTLPDLIRYADQIVYPYAPRQVVIYEGDNDLAQSDTITAETVLKRFKQLYGMIRKHLPNTSIAFISIKPSPSRQRLMPKMQQANALIQHFLKNKKKSAFIDVYHKMLTRDGTPDKSIFTADELHMNARGYAIWKKVIQPYLLKN